MFNQRELDNRYERPIIGDGKGYYAYLPAIFIYQDFSYSFVDDMEEKYYPTDGFLDKTFKAPQPNGKVVNKYFPGVAIYYLPFFGCAALFSWIFGFPIDGYSLPFQWSIGIAHLFYLCTALIFLDKAMRNLAINRFARNISLFAAVFATNVYFYVIYDHSVTHVFGFCGTSIFIWLLTQYKKTAKFKFIAWSFVILAILFVTRPTNIFCVVFFLNLLEKNQILQILNLRNWMKGKNALILFISISILFLLPILWKVQSGYWVVYSYGEEGFDFLKPLFFKYLFAFEQGWWIWTPIMLPVFVLSGIYFFDQNRVQGAFFFIGILSIVYVFSCWWIWTFGTSFGQRPMIDFYPILIVGFAGFIHKFKLKYSLLLIVPFVLMNCFQSFQRFEGIHTGGEVSRDDYFNHFFKTRRDASVVKISSEWELIRFSAKKSKPETIDENSPFSELCQISIHQQEAFYVVTVELSGENDKTNCQLVFTGENGSNYQAQYLQKEIYKDQRTFSFKYSVSDSIETPISCYVWNDSRYAVEVHNLKIQAFQKKE